MFTGELRLGHVFSYGDIDYFRQQLDFTWDPVRFKGLPEYIDWLHGQGMKFITILDPAIDSEEANYTVFSDGQQRDIWIKWPERRNVQFNETKNRNMLGYVWPYGLFVSFARTEYERIHFQEKPSFPIISILLRKNGGRSRFSTIIKPSNSMDCGST